MWVWGYSVLVLSNKTHNKTKMCFIMWVLGYSVTAFIWQVGHLEQKTSEILVFSPAATFCACIVGCRWMRALSMICVLFRLFRMRVVQEPSDLIAHCCSTFVFCCLYLHFYVVLSAWMKWPNCKCCHLVDRPDTAVYSREMRKRFTQAADDEICRIHHAWYIGAIWGLTRDTKLKQQQQQ